MRKYAGLPGVRTRVSQKAGRKQDLGSVQEGPRPGMAGDAWSCMGTWEEERQEKQGAGEKGLPTLHSMPALSPGRRG